VFVPAWVPHIWQGGHQSWRCDQVHAIELADRAHLNMVEAFASLPSHLPGGFVRRRGGIVVAATGSPFALFNEIMPVEDVVDADALVAAVQETRVAGLSSFTQLRDGIDDALLRVVSDLGLQEVANFSWPAMVLTDLPHALDLPAGFEIRRVANRAQFEDHLRWSSAIAGVDSAFTATWLGESIADDPAWALITGHVDGAVVSRSMGFRTGDVIGIYNVGTLKPARRRGYGWAVTLAAIMAGVEAGCTVATLQSSAMALPMYEAHGFRRLFQYRAFLDRGPASSPAARS
jgi:GNAT superfamily N-acetyltransferase